jgi:hypothetical protein
MNTDELSTKNETEALNKHNVSRSCYRVVTDYYLGYEVQVRVKFLFWAWWKQVGFTNTHSSLEKAQKWIKDGCPKQKYQPKEVWKSGNCG